MMQHLAHFDAPRALAGWIYVYNFNKHVNTHVCSVYGMPAISNGSLTRARCHSEHAQINSTYFALSICSKFNMHYIMRRAYKSHWCVPHFPHVRARPIRLVVLQPLSGLTTCALSGRLGQDARHVLRPGVNLSLSLNLRRIEHHDDYNKKTCACAMHTNTRGFVVCFKRLQPIGGIAKPSFCCVHCTVASVTHMYDTLQPWMGVKHRAV